MDNYPLIICATPSYLEHWSKALIMPLTIWNCVLSCKKKNYFSENWLVLTRNHFQNRIPR